jgi:hypothetical protein
MAPALARWLTPDAPTRAPETKFLLAPWDLNPYSYVRSNPLVYWDPDGHSWETFGEGFVSGFATGLVTVAVISAAAVLAPAAAPYLAAAAIGYGVGSLIASAPELWGMAQRAWSHQTTDDDHRVLGEIIGADVGGRFGAPLGVAIGKGVKSAISPAAATEGSSAMRVRTGLRAGSSGGAGGGSGNGRSTVSAAARLVLKWDNWKSGPTFGHAFLEHGAQISRESMMDRARGARAGQNGQWVNNAKAAQFIALIARMGPGTHDVPLPPGLGRAFNATGEIVADMARVIVKASGAVDTAFPFRSAGPNP